MMDEANYQDYHLRSKWVRVLGGAFLMVLVLRMGYLQIIQGEKLFTFSQNNQLRKERIPALRGLILDRQSRILADYRFRFDVVVIPQFLKHPQEVFAYLAEIFEKPVEQLLSDYRFKARQQPKFQPVIIQKDVSDEVMAKVEEHKRFFSGLDTRMIPTRNYPHGGLFAHVLGYVAEANQEDIQNRSEGSAHRAGPYEMGDLIGRRGLELSGESFLRGQPGLSYVQVDAHGRQTEQTMELASFWETIESRPSVQGISLKTTLDVDVQRAMAQAFGESSSGAGVVIHVHSGRILALVSLPTFDPNQLADHWLELSMDPAKPLYNRTVQGVYPPGSTFKVITALAGLSLGAIRDDLHVQCPGYYRLGRETKRCWKKHGHGMVNLHSAISQSCDVFFYQLGRKIGIQNLAEFASGLGLGAPLQIELQHERSGLVPTPEWKQKRYGEPWVEGETLSVSIGQGALGVTPLQLAVAISAVLNGGTVYRPYILESLMPHSGEPGRIISSPKVLRQNRFDPEKTERIRKAMVGVMQEPGGTGYQRRSKVIELGGKTGTAQVRSFGFDELFSKCEEWPLKNRHHALFVGFWPAEAPEYVSVAVKEHGCSGSAGALPIVRDTLEVVAAQAFELESLVEQKEAP
jgi:penicillin-binding protein 2